MSASGTMSEQEEELHYALSYYRRLLQHSKYLAIVIALGAEPCLNETVE